MRSLGLALVALAGLLVFEGCGSDSSNTVKKTDLSSTGGAGGGGGAPAAGSTGGPMCNPAYCPPSPTGAAKCCVDANTCGFDTGNGCVAGSPDAGAH